MKTLLIIYSLSMVAPKNDSLLFKQFNRIDLLIDSAFRTSNVLLEVQAVNLFNESYASLLQLCKASKKKKPKVSLATFNLAISLAQKLRYVEGVIKLNNEFDRLWMGKHNVKVCKDCRHTYHH